ncbi:MAG: hypothetical protein RL758_279 [Pseudomonadota bacterium]
MPMPLTIGRAAPDARIDSLYGSDWANTPESARAVVSHQHLMMRLNTALVTVFFGVITSYPAVMIAFSDQTILARVAAVAGIGTWASAGFALAALLYLPFLVVQLRWPFCKARRTIAKVAAFGSGLAGVLWILLSFVGRRTDFGPAIEYLSVFGALNLAFAFVIALSLNNELLLLSRRKAE